MWAETTEDNSLFLDEQLPNNDSAYNPEGGPPDEDGKDFHNKF